MLLVRLLGVVGALIAVLAACIPPVDVFAGCGWLFAAIYCAELASRELQQ
jgi:hypothetical protein